MTATKREWVLGWVKSVGKSLPAPEDDDAYEPGLEAEDYDWRVTVVSEKAEHTFRMDAGGTHPMPLLGKWVEVGIDCIMFNGERITAYDYAAKMIEREQ